MASPDLTLNRHAYALGPVACLTKPFRREALLAVIQTTLHGVPVAGNGITAERSAGPRPGPRASRRGGPVSACWADARESPSAPVIHGNLCLPEDRLNPGNQLIEVEGLDDEIRGARFQATHHVLFMPEGREHDDRNPVQNGIGL